MRCPKCQYISFDSGDRCRNCGYEFSLASEESPIEVTIARDEPGPGRLHDASLTAFEATLTPAEDEVPEAEVETFNAARPLPTASDLPLFTERVADDQAPLVMPPAVPRPPLSVRRANPAARGHRRSAEPEELSLDLAGGSDRADAVDSNEGREPAVETGGLAGIVRRAFAGLVDVVILGTIGAMVFYLTLRLCELAPDEWRTLPLVPLAAFLLLLCGGYFVLFTAAGGQTIGKMATGIRVVAGPPGDDTRVSFGGAVMRTVACLGSVAALGAGFLPVLFSADRRAFHDRVADTRVVPA
jgi:uncharacterized RDD family membrane protein YckC